ncbi:MAG: BrnT family toxin [Opitutaceae bacterium]|jgi:hypothetical protein
MHFEFDPAKSEANKAKHGIDFFEAQRLWLDKRNITIPSRYPSEPRFLLIGVLEEKHWIAIYTYRGNTIRLISVRRARKEEIEIYESD